MRMYAGYWLIGLACLLLSASSALAVPWIDVTVDPAFPEYVANPGGTVTVDCSFTVPDPPAGQIGITILDPEGTAVLHESYPGAATLRHEWTVPEGMMDGFYVYRVAYDSDTGQDGYTDATFEVILPSTGICAFKIIDNNANGVWDEGIDQHGAGWEICAEPGLGCLTTGSQYGEACWFFIQPGTYQVCETLQAGYFPVTPECQIVDVAYLQIVEVDFFNTPLGACCFHPGGDCIELTEEECIARGGSFVGDFTTCYPGLCPATATEPSTWGVLKRLYR